MKQIKDFINEDVPIIITIKRRDGGPPGSEDYEIYAICRTAQDLIVSLEDFLSDRSLTGYELEKFKLAVYNNHYIPDDIHLDTDIEYDGDLSELANVFAMTVEQLASESESDSNFAAWTNDIKKESEIFGDYYDPKVKVTILLQKDNSTYYSVNCRQVPFNEKKHDAKVLARFNASNKRVSPTY